MLRGLVPLAVALLPTPALAQAYQCSVPLNIGPAQPVRPDGPSRSTPIGGFTLAASWSPEYCKTGHDAKAMQCSQASGRFGFVLHGLWPESPRGPYPQWCGTPQVLAPALLRQHLCMTPSVDLLAHEWAKHGSCMARSPEAYFRTAERVWRKIQWPDADRLARKRDLTVGDLRDDFVAANRDWPRAAVGVLLSDKPGASGGWLREVHLCLDRAMRPAPCPASRSGPGDAMAMKIWRGL